MNSESEKNYLAAKQDLKNNISAAAKPTPCVMITEQNWSAMVGAVKAMEKMLGETVTNDAMIDYLTQMTTILSNRADWLESKERSIASQMEAKAELIKTDLEKQAGNMKDQYASELKESRQAMQEDFRIYMGRMYRLFLVPCLVLILLLVVLVLHQILGQ